MKLSPSSLINSAVLAISISCCTSMAFAGQQFETGTSLYYFDYVEDCPPPLKSTEKDLIIGSFAAYTYTGDDTPFFGRLRLEFAYAATAYDGTNQQGIPLKGTTVNGFITGEIDLGYQFTGRSRHPFHLTPYIGFGYKYRYRDLGSYTEDYSWKYIPIGILAGKELDDKWAVALDASLRFMFDGEIKVKLSKNDSGYNDPKGDLGSRTGFRVALPVIYRIQPTWAIVLTPWYEYSALGHCEPFIVTYNGEPKYAAYEPDSRTHQYGGDLGVRLFF